METAFLLLLLLAAYLDLSSVQVPQVNNKALHFVTYFALTITFYWILDTSRRRLLNLTLLLVTCGLGVGYTILQGLLPNGLGFDPVDILANVLGSLLALGLCSVYHKRMLDRRRRRKGYGDLPQDGAGEDLELGDGRRQVEGTVDVEPWDETQRESSAEEEAGATPSSNSAADDGPETKS
ncbi:MAG: hypothetical protein Q9214_002974 [Letrouitia sp. 1 TL-2023]